MYPVIRLNDKGNKKVYYRIVVIGAGANGSHFVRNLCQIASSFKKLSENNDMIVDIVLVDEDRVESKNLNNQLFSTDDIGDFKVDALAERYGEHYEMTVKAVPEYVKDESMLYKLFDGATGSNDTSHEVIPVLLGMVDNNKTRQLFHRFFMNDKVENLMYLDAGVEGMSHFEKSSLTPEQEIEKQMSGFSGQIVCGLKWRGEVILPPVTEVYPNILTDERTSFPGESCGELVLNNPQRVMTNQYAAQLATGYMNNLFQKQWIFTSATTFTAQFMGARPTFVTQEQVDHFERAKQAEAGGKNK